MKFNWKQKLSLLIALSFGLTTHADPLQSISSIEQAAYEYSLTKALENHDNPQLVLGKLDSRLRLQQCSERLTAFSRNDTNWLGNTTVGVKCNRPVAWTIYVPVDIKVYKPIYVTARSLEAHTIITASDLKLQRYDISSLKRGYVQNRSDIIGKQLKYAVKMGQVLKSTQLRQQKIISRGEQVALVVASGSMEVRMNGTALSDATLGQRVRVKNTSSKRVVEGIVDAPGVVKVQL